MSWMGQPWPGELISKSSRCYEKAWISDLKCALVVQKLKKNCLVILLVVSEYEIFHKLFCGIR